MYMVFSIIVTTKHFLEHLGDFFKTYGHTAGFGLRTKSGNLIILVPGWVKVMIEQFGHDPINKCKRRI